MLRQASRRNAAAIRAGRVTLINASVDQLPAALDGPFDAILAVNSLGFWLCRAGAGTVPRRPAGAESSVKPMAQRVSRVGDMTGSHRA